MYTGKKEMILDGPSYYVNLISYFSKIQIEDFQEKNQFKV